MKSRLKGLRSYFHLSQREFALEINVSQSTLSMFGLGKRKLNNIHIHRIISEFPINEQWLYIGEGKMLKQLSEKEQLTSYITDSTIENDTFIKKLYKSIYAIKY